MNRVDDYRMQLQKLDVWEPYLLRESGLPGPRANLELLQVVAEEGDTGRFLRLLENTPLKAPSGSREEYLAACGATGLGERIARGEAELWPRLRALASDPRWRVREGVAMGLQRIGDVDIDGLIGQMRHWATGGLLERRAAIAGLCEPRLLKSQPAGSAALDILDLVTQSLEREQGRKGEDFRILRQALGYCWSVAIAANPVEGMNRFERWTSSDDSDVRWVVRENLKKRRLQKVDREWVARMGRQMERSS